MCPLKNPMENYIKNWCGLIGALVHHRGLSNSWFVFPSQTLRKWKQTLRASPSNNWLIESVAEQRPCFLFHRPDLSAAPVRTTTASAAGRKSPHCTYSSLGASLGSASWEALSEDRPNSNKAHLIPILGCSLFSYPKGLGWRGGCR